MNLNTQESLINQYVERDALENQKLVGGITAICEHYVQM
jgi:hypothetical protein